MRQGRPNRPRVVTSGSGVSAHPMPTRRTGATCWAPAHCPSGGRDHGFDQRGAGGRPANRADAGRLLCCGQVRHACPADRGRRYRPDRFAAAAGAGCSTHRGGRARPLWPRGRHASRHRRAPHLADRRRPRSHPGQALAAHAGRHRRTRGRGSGRRCRGAGRLVQASGLRRGQLFP